MPKKFFERQTEQSAIKARIVQKYFAAWAKIMISAARKRGGGKIAYIDLFSGPGRYEDGKPSTPILILEKAINDPLIGDSLVAIFNESRKNRFDALRNEIIELPDVDKLKHKPIVNYIQIGEDVEEYFSRTKLIPTFTFIDPFGYKGVTSNLIKGVTKDWGCDCIFFFNYSRINAGISNLLVANLINDLFGEDRADQLRSKVIASDASVRQEMILEEMSQALREDVGTEFVLPFCFNGQRIIYHLIFVTKNFKGYEVMKEIMTNESSTKDQGVASFSYSKADESMPFLFEMLRPLDDLEDLLLIEYAGKTLTTQKIYREHSVGRPYILRNYKYILRKLEEEGKISVVDPEGKRGRGFPERLVVTFPETENGK